MAKLREILAQNSAKEEGRLPTSLLTEDRILLKIGQVISQTNWKIWILLQKNQAIFTGGGTPTRLASASLYMRNVHRGIKLN